MAKNFQQEGDVIQYTNSSGSKVSAGKVIAIAGLLAVALVDIENGATGSAKTTGVFLVEKKGSSGTLEVGTTLKFDPTTGKFDKPDATGASGHVSGACAMYGKKLPTMTPPCWSS